MDTTLEKLINDLLTSKNEVDSIDYITTYIKLIKIDDLNLSYINFDSDIKIIINKLIDTYSTIYINYKKKLTQKYKPSINIFGITEKIITSRSDTIIDNLNNNTTYLKTILKYFDIENQKFKLYTEDETNNFVNNINSIALLNFTAKTKQEHEEERKNNNKLYQNIIFFKKYIKKNNNLYQAYSNIIYVYMFISYIDTFVNKNKKFIKFNFELLLEICDKYFYNANDVIYEYQLHYESHDSTTKKQERSKILIDLIRKKKCKITDLYNEIKNNPGLYFNKDDKLVDITMTSLDPKDDTNNDATEKTLLLHKFNTVEPTEKQLQKTYGLRNIDIYKLLNNSNLPICYPERSRITLTNDIRIYHRSAKDFEIGKLVFYDNDYEIDKTTKYILKSILFLIKGYTFNIVEGILYVNLNSITDIDFTEIEYKHINDKLSNCKHRYMFIYCSVNSFGEKEGYMKNITGGHKTSIIIDREKKEIIFFEPVGFEGYNVYNSVKILGDYGYFNTSILNIIIALELEKNIPALNNYTFLYNNLNIQLKEHIGLYLDKITNYNLKQIISKEKKALMDWSGGYCGLWNFMFMFLLIINPLLGIQDIYMFLYKINNMEHNTKIIKLLIRNFAYHIENAFNVKNYVIPVQEVILDKSRVQLMNNAKTYIQGKINKSGLAAQISENNENVKAIQKYKKFQFFNKELTFNENIKVGKDIYNLIADFTKIIFSNGGLALYTPDKINFLQIY